MSVSLRFASAFLAAILLYCLSIFSASPAKAARICHEGYYINFHGDCEPYGDSDEDDWANWGHWANWGSSPAVSNVVPYIGFNISVGDNGAKWSEPDGSVRHIDPSGLQANVAIGAWLSPVTLYPLRPWEAEFLDYCLDVNWHDDDCWDYWGDMTNSEARALLHDYYQSRYSQVVRSRYAAETKKPQSGVKWPIKPAKPGSSPLLLRFGIENDFGVSGFNGSTTVACAAACRVSNSFLDTLLGKAGLQFGRFMPYLAGGLAYGNIHTVAGTFGGNTVWNTGWAAGGGIQYDLTRSLSAKAEFLHVDLGNGSCAPATCGGVATIHLTENLVRIGLDYHFSTGGGQPGQAAPPFATK
jgi:opacity protein-like surface antigen